MDERQRGTSRKIHVLVSYSHDNPDHLVRVLALTDRLRHEGIDAIIDLYEVAPQEGWPIWMTRQVMDSDFALLICTEIYRRRAMKEEEPRTGLGASWEAHLIIQELYQRGGHNDRFLPVLLEGGDPQHIPWPLQSFTYYRVDDETGYKALYRRITGQHPVPAPIVGAILDLPLSPRSSFVLESREPSGHGMRPPFDQTIENPWPLSPWWFRLPAEASRCLPDNGCILVRPPSAPASTNLHKVLSPEETDSVSRLKDSSLRFLSADRLENGGWGKRNNKALRSFFDELPDDFDTEGSVTLTRWAIDAISFSSLAEDMKAQYLDGRLVDYLDTRFDRDGGGSGRLVKSAVGRSTIHLAPRHTAASILCYLGLRRPHYQSCSKLQVKYLHESYSKCFREPSEVGHPDILRALCLSLLSRTQGEHPDGTALHDLIRKGFEFLWDWLTSPHLIPDRFGRLAHLYLQIYSLASLSDLAGFAAIGNCLEPLIDYRRHIHEKVEELCRSSAASDHRSWGFPALLLWSYLCCPDERVGAEDLKALLRRIESCTDFHGDGFCVYWAVLFSVADCLTRSLR